MFKKRIVSKDTYYVGASDRRLALFENVYPVEYGMSYNSYLIIDSKTCLLDTVDKSVEDEFLIRLKDTLDDRKLDYLVVHHMEPDHSYTLKRVLELHPEVTLVINDKALKMFKNFNDDFVPKNILLVKNGDQLNLGNHILNFVFAPMVHRPEVMVSYDSYSKTLFSADAFGSFNALSGNLIDSEIDIDASIDEYRRYYTNIVGKYGVQVQALLKKASELEIETICPLHGVILKENIAKIVSLYDKWSKYEPEVKSTLIVYGSIYGHSEEVATLISESLALKDVKNIKIYDASKIDKSILVSESFKYSNIVICASTYNMGIFTPMEEYLLDLKYHNLSNRTVAIVDNGSWAITAGKLVKDIFATMKNIKVLETSFSITSKIKSDELYKIDLMVDEIIDSLK